jgi:phosphopantetheine adenylyltransferase
MRNKERIEALAIPLNAHGEVLKQLQIKFVNLLSGANDEKDRFALFVSARKSRIEDIIAKATLSLQTEEAFKNAKSTIQSKVLNALVREYRIKVDYQEQLDSETIAEKLDNDLIETNLSTEEHMLNLDNFRYSKAKSRCEELEQLLWVCRSGLAFDKLEFKQLNASSGE